MKDNRRRYILAALSSGLVLILLLSVVVLVLRDSSIKPERVLVTNITDGGASVTWYTEKPTVSRVQVKEKGSGTWMTFAPSLFDATFFDDRDVDQNQSGEWVVQDGNVKRHTHHVTLRELDPDKEYEIAILGGFTSVLSDNDGNPLPDFTTKSLRKDIKVPDPAYGQVLNLDGLDKSDSLVIFDIFSKENAQPLGKFVSSTLSDSGTYSIDINSFPDVLVSEPENYTFDVYVVDEKNEVTNFNLFTDKYKPFPNLDFVRPKADAVSLDQQQSGLFSKALVDVHAQGAIDPLSDGQDLYAQPALIECGHGYSYDNSSQTCVCTIGRVVSSECLPTVVADDIDRDKNGVRDSLEQNTGGSQTPDFSNQSSSLCSGENQLMFPGVGCLSSSRCRADGNEGAACGTSYLAVSDGTYCRCEARSAATDAAFKNPTNGQISQAQLNNEVYGYNDKAPTFTQPEGTACVDIAHAGGGNYVPYTCSNGDKICIARQELTSQYGGDPQKACDDKQNIPLLAQG